MVLVDANILIDLVTNDSAWSSWSLARLEEAALAGSILINDVIYSEISMGFQRIEDLDLMLAETMVGLVPMPRAALFLAGKAFRQYRANGGTRTGVLPDFFIGAHAAAQGWPILTRDVRRYQTYFPTVRLIAPSS
ncbi:DNA-binding protein [Labrys miyagiensis]|uniref:DNA-binding protein n=1 Tax=Labrys miyagiensis TaxID=346912 RepID=A0ABQ6CLD7_9HYPH|nr:type II toxin-antitoxin system VapC family toxin [Labrys miyagiensis]GLS21176.1 DNA-binding protein [Labrys miyagiensis]